MEIETDDSSDSEGDEMGMADTYVDILGIKDLSFLF